jgi:hypothetical protein
VLPLFGGAWLLNELLNVRAPALHGWPRVAAFWVPVVILFAVLIRTEQFLGTFRLYRWVRNGLRLLLPSFVFNLGARVQLNLPDPDVGGAIRETFTNPSLLAATVAGATFMCVVLWLGSYVRADWHRALEALRLRSASLSG